MQKDHLFPRFVPRFLDSNERASIVGTLRDMNLPCRLGKYEVGDGKGGMRPFMHARDHRYGFRWNEARTWLADRPGQQWSCRLSLKSVPVFVKDRRLFVVRAGGGFWSVPMHFDCTWNLAVGLEGTRTFYLNPPGPVHPTTYRYTVTVGPGDALLIPPGWWHEVHNRDGFPSLLGNVDLSDTYRSRLPNEVYQALERAYGAYWPGRAYEFDTGYDETHVSVPSGFRTAVDRGVDRYHDLLVQGGKNHTIE
eukprot:scaffold225_cov267-Pavlova_lutheri.AAC.3